ncbi:MAG: hypothetical protein P8Y02_12470 [Deinococcales bacterium]
MRPSEPPPPSSAPTPDLTAEATLSAVLAALAAHDRPSPDHGVAVAYAFASDRMRAALGDERAFGRALHNALNAPLLGHVAAQVTSLDERGDAARAAVEVTTTGGDSVRYTVALVRPDRGPRRGCWLIGGIAREGVDL